MPRGAPNWCLRDGTQDCRQSNPPCHQTGHPDAAARQLCGGQVAGIEAAIHSVRREFSSESAEAILLVDASNAFNSLNRKAALHNVQFLCPSLSTALINMYHAPTELFVDGVVLSSEEGTTQGDPLAMPLYAMASVPLIQQLDDVEGVRQVWYGDWPLCIPGGTNCR